MNNLNLITNYNKLDKEEMKDMALEKISEMYFDPYFSQAFSQFVVEHIDSLSEDDFQKLVESCCLEEVSKIKFYN